MFKFHDCTETSKVPLVAALPGNPLLLILCWNAGQEQIFTVWHMLGFRMCDSVCCFKWYSSHKRVLILIQFSTFIFYYSLFFYEVVANSVCNAFGADVSSGIFHGIAPKFSHFLFFNLLQTIGVLRTISLKPEGGNKGRGCSEEHIPWQTVPVLWDRLQRRSHSRWVENHCLGLKLC